MGYFKAFCKAVHMRADRSTMASFAWAMVALLSFAILLSGCAANPKITASPTFVCVEIKKYSREQQNRMADELEKHADQIPAVAEAIDDYGNLRSALRKVCKAK